MSSGYRIKVGLASCGIAAGAAKTYQALSRQASDRAQVIAVGCLGMCYCEPLVEVIDGDGESYLYGNVTEEEVARLVSEHLEQGKVVTDLLIRSSAAGYPDKSGWAKQVRFTLQNCGVIDPEDIGSYLEAGGYMGLHKALKEMTPEQVIDAVRQSGLRGRGGAGFPTHLKWSFTRQAAGAIKYVICNADEGDPGAFMDRSILESDPHSVVEGMLLAGYAIGASKGFIYVRAEYPLAVKRLGLAIDQARQRRFLGQNILESDFHFDIEIREGAGAFVCGEETALLASIEGKRGMPRFRPPFPSEKGLFKHPTSINNVETFANVPRIIYLGPEAFSKYGTEKSKGTKVFALAGKINRGGLVEIPMGTTINEIVFDIGGGVASGKALKAVQTGGPSGGCIPAHLGDTPVDYESLADIGAIMGSGGLLIMDEDTCMVNVAQYFLSFGREESCGKCTFCRVGTEQMLRILNRITAGQGQMADIETLEKLGRHVKMGSLCGLGQTVSNPILTTLKYFRNEYQAHIQDRVCPAKICKALIEYRIQPYCVGCGLCVKACPVNAISGQRREVHEIDGAACIRCGLCVSSCKFGAIKVVSEPKGHPQVEVAK